MGVSSLEVSLSWVVVKGNQHKTHHFEDSLKKATPYFCRRRGSHPGGDKFTSWCLLAADGNVYLTTSLEADPKLQILEFGRTQAKPHTRTQKLLSCSKPTF